MHRSANYCFSEYNHFKYALRVLEKAADYREQLEKFSLDKSISDEDVQRYSQLQAEFYLLRTSLV